MEADKLYQLAAEMMAEALGDRFTEAEQQRLKALCDDYASDPGGFERRQIQRDLGVIKVKIRAMGGTVND